MIIGIVLFFFMAVIAILTMGVVERLSFDSYYAGHDAQKLTDAKYVAVKAIFFVERTSSLYFNNKLESLDFEKIFLDESLKRSVSGKKVYLLESLSSGQNYVYYVNSYRDWLVEGYAPFIESIDLDSIEGLPPISSLKYSLVFDGDDLIGFYFGSKNDDALSIMEEIKLKDGAGSMYYRPHFRVSLPDALESNFGSFVSSVLLRRQELYSECNSLDGSDLDYTIQKVLGVRVISLKRSFNGVNFVSEFSCASPSNGGGISIPLDPLPPNSGGSIFPVVLPEFGDNELPGGNLPPIDQPEFCIPDFIAIPTALESITEFDVILSENIEQMVVDEQVIVRPDECGDESCKFSVEVDLVSGTSKVTKIERVVQTKSGDLVNIISEVKATGEFEQVDAQVVDSAHNVIDLGGDFEDDSIRHLDSAVLLDMHTCLIEGVTTGILSNYKGKTDYLVGVDVDSQMGEIIFDLDMACSEAPWEKLKNIMLRKKKFEAIVPPSYDVLLKGGEMFPIPEEFRGDSTKKIKIEANEETGESEIVEIKVVEETDIAIYEDTYVPTPTGGWAFTETAEVESVYQGVSYDDTVYDGPIILTSDFDTSCAGNNVVHKAGSSETYAITFTDDSGQDQYIQNIAPDSSGFYLVFE